VAPNVSPREFFDTVVRRVSATVRVFYFRYVTVAHYFLILRMQTRSKRIRRKGTERWKGSTLWNAMGRKACPRNRYRLVKGTTSRADLQLAK